MQLLKITVFCQINKCPKKYYKGLSFGSMFLLFLVTAFLLLYAGLIIFYWYHWLRLEDFTYDKEARTAISVVVAARNEEKTLPLTLRSLQAQTYPEELIEVIIVDDYSTDNTAEVIRPFLTERVKYMRPAWAAHQSSKTRAIDTGVRSSTHELIVITDADCLVPSQWLATISAYYEATGARFIAAPVRYEVKNNLLELLQAVDFMVLQGITAASVSARFHTMANGANLAYTKRAFLEVNGFEGIDSLASGDDMLLMQKIWKKNKQDIGYLKSSAAMVSTLPMQDWKGFIHQRRRWAGKSAYYDDRNLKTILVLVYLFNLLFFVLLFIAFLKPQHWSLVFYYLLGKIVIELPFFVSISRFYKEQKLVPFFLLLQPIHILYTVIIGLFSQFGTYEWKNRRTK
jgi:cellulose synthase/poly-beta-1,6-N-acetylglucosamine synthase-like glycosyltransferase